MDETLYESEGNVQTDVEHSASTENDMLKCDTCNKTYVSLYCIERHISIHVSDRVHRCNICFKDFLDSDVLQKHKTIKHKNGKRCSREKQKYKCIICSKMLFEKEVKGHYLEHNISHPFRCYICNIGFTFPGNLQRHTKTAHTVGNEKSLYQCSWCKKLFTTAYNLKEHERIHTGENVIYTCGICNKTHNDRSNFNRHMQQYHRVGKYAHKEKKNTFMGTFKCVYCEKTFASRYRLREHVGYVHFGENSNLCYTCGKSFSNTFELKRHNHVHTGENLIKCDRCDIFFTRRSSLNRHIAARHTSKFANGVECKLCHKRFTRAWSLQNHMKLHTGFGQYLCNVCGDSFAYKRSLHDHIADKHCADPELHSCKFCEKSYNTKLRLLSHMSARHAEYRSLSLRSLDRKDRNHMTFTNEKNGPIPSQKKPAASPKLSFHKETQNDNEYICAICNSVFKRVANLKFHMKIHSGDSEFCTLCNKYFRGGAELRRHIKSARHTRKANNN